LEERAIANTAVHDRDAISRAAALSGRAAWLTQLGFLRRRGVKFDRRVGRGMTHSLPIHDLSGYSVELPHKVREGDIDVALNHAVALPTEGAEAPRDSAENLQVFAPTTEVC
jgi:hypothetical protein